LVIEMLSIGKLVAGQAKYYLDQAELRVDVVGSVGDGIEDYYVVGQESRGDWIGSASRELGLERGVEAMELRCVLAGLDPRDGAPLRAASGRARVGGFDLTFSAPKSVSVLFGVGDAHLRAEVRVAHDDAVREAVGYLERSAAAVRRGHGGAVVEEASGLVAAAFRHRTSRAGDPQLHTHVLVANLGRGLDGRWSALDGRRLYAHARAASFIYQAVLRGELTDRLGVEWLPVRKGIAEVVGVPRPVLHAFSRRRAEIDAALAEHGTSGARAAEAAALATRRAKDSRVRPDDLVGEWRSRAEALGLGREELERIVGREAAVRPDAMVWECVFKELAGPLGLTRRSATFSRDDVLQAICDALPTGSRVAARTLEAAGDRFLDSPEAVAVLPESELRADGGTFRRRDGRIMPVAVEALRYSTPAHLALEQRLVGRIVASRDAGAGTADEGDVARTLAARPSLSSEQRAVVERLCLDGDRVAIVAGKAGTGKTYALGAAREAWQDAGHPVLGVAVARRAAAELRDGAGIESTSAAALLAALGRDGERLPERCVLVVDEAGMVPTRQLSELLDQVERVDGKLVLVGDHRQLPELEAGGTFGALVNRGLALELHENLRQVHAWEREALDHLRGGRPEAALDLYAAHGRLHVELTAGASRSRLVEDWSSIGHPDGAVMIAQRRLDVADLNARARARMRDAGAVTGPELRLSAGAFAAGDWVVVKRNDIHAGISNGERGRVVAVDQATGSLSLECGRRRVRLGRDFLLDRTRDGDPTLMHGYAITGHVAQGVTVDHAFILAGEGISREWAYVALSRGRESNSLYLAADPEDLRAEFAPREEGGVGPIERLANGLRASSAQVLAIDSGRPVEPPGDVAEARRELDASRDARRKLEGERFGWLPGRRERLDDARQREADARANVRRADAEQRHGARPFIGDQDAQTSKLRELVQDRAAERVLGRDRGRDLER
jgi:conjugative relaxase-like TrwC/TraI family protein